MNLYIENMTCGGCSKGVTASIQAVDLNADIQIDLSTKLVQIYTQATTESIVASLTEDGFPPIIK